MGHAEFSKVTPTTRQAMGPTEAGKGTRRYAAHAAAIAAEFDEKAGSYEMNRLAPWYEAQGSLVQAHLGLVHGPILDVGCGTGWFIRQVLAATPGGRAIGVDLASEMIAEAKRRAAAAGLAGATFVTGDWEADDTRERVRTFLPAGATAVVCVSTLHYFREPVEALRGMARLLAPGGRLLLMERSLDRSPLTSIWDFIHRKVVRDRVRFYRENELLAFMSEAGFHETGIVARVRRWFWKRKLFTSLVLVEGFVREAPSAHGGNQPVKALP
jgi:ubiquinone/menaquinone biosynthesis C-methylase UbiE